MKNKPVYSLVLSVVLSSSLAGCGGLAKRSECPNGSCSPPVCPEDTYLVGASCVPLSVCGTGTYVLVAATSTTDQVCEPCPSGMFASVENQLSCTPWSTCPAGTFVSNTPTDRNDRLCLPCAVGTLTSGPNRSTCTRADQCAAGTVQTAAGSSTSAPVCASCQAGEYCAGGSQPMLPCEEGKWDDDEDPATACVAWSACGPGSFVAHGGTPTADRQCTRCSAGSFTTATNAVACQTWTTCEPGTYVANTPSASSDRQCVACPPDSYTESENLSACLAAHDCPAGTIEFFPGSGSSGPECIPCTVGEFCAGGGTLAKPCADETWDHDRNPATACAPWTLCRPGDYVAVSGSASQDQSCLACPDGTFSAVADSPACAPWSDCPAGTYVGSMPTSGSDRICIECSSGSFSSKLNANTCEAVSECPAYTTFVSVPATHAEDTVCTPCTEVGCAMYCDSGGNCLDCLSDADCQASAMCIDGLCTETACTGGSIYFSESFATGSDQGWRTSDLLGGPWEIGPASDYWSGGTVRDGTYPDPIKDHTTGDDENEMMAGVIIGGVAPPQNASAPHYLISPTIDLSGLADKVYLEYYHWLNSDSSLTMINTVEVFDGGNWVPIWSGPPANAIISEGSWERRIHDVTAFRNSLFAVRFGYDILSSSAQPVSSWNLDDIRVASTPSCR
jgi:hypothetical protein